MFEMFDSLCPSLFVRDFEYLTGDEFLTDSSCFRGSIVHQIFLKGHKSVRVAAVLDLTDLAKSHKTVTGSSGTIAGSAE